MATSTNTMKHHPERWKNLLEHDNLGDVVFVLKSNQVCQSIPEKQPECKDSAATSIMGIDEDDDDNDDLGSIIDDSGNIYEKQKTRSFECIGALFAAQSQVFKAMIFGKMAETKLKNSNKT